MTAEIADGCIYPSTGARRPEKGVPDNKITHYFSKTQKATWAVQICELCWMYTQSGKITRTPKIPPLAQRRIRKVQRLRGALDALAFGDFVHCLTPTKEARFLGLLDAGISGRQGAIGKLQFEGPHEGTFLIIYYRNYTHRPRGRARLPSYRNKSFSTQIFQELLMVWSCT